MAKRRFQLPGIQDLSKEQEDARALPMEGQHLIVGGPGTGKSILALLRARRLAQEEVDYIFLVYNHLLNESSKQLLDGSLVSRTWNSWFSRLYQESIDAPLPTLEPPPGSSWRPIDWISVLDRISNVEPKIRKTTLVVDEGQDMPPEFYQALANMGFENFFVMADQNQQITDGLNSTRQDIAASLAIKDELKPVDMSLEFIQSLVCLGCDDSFMMADQNRNFDGRMDSTRQDIAESLGIKDKSNIVKWLGNKVWVKDKENSDELKPIDMSLELIQSLVCLGCDDSFVMADQNRNFDDRMDSTRQDIAESLGIKDKLNIVKWLGNKVWVKDKDSSDVIELKFNYRNKYAVARLAREFYTGDPASPPPELPPMPSISIKTPLCYEYEVEMFHKLIRRILKTADRDPSKLIGILTYNNDDRKRYVSALRSCDVRLDNPKPLINTFSSNEKNKVSFDQGGILVINAKTCKGLEFDTVFIADINSFICNEGNVDNVKRLFYVMVARAIDRVILLKKRGQYCAVDSILPVDEAILERG